MNKFKDYIFKNSIKDKKEQLKAIKEDGYNIQFIKNPIIETILIAIEKDIDNFQYINNIFSLKDQEYLIRKIPQLLWKYPSKFNKSLKLKYKYLLVPGNLGIFDE